MPVVIFPGNVGDENALATVLQRLRPEAGAELGSEHNKTLQARQLNQAV
jgi:hypothetical protein